MDRASARGCYDVLAVGNTESVVLVTAVADPPPALNDPRYADVKVEMVSVNVNGGRNGNGRCGRGGGEGGLKEEKDDNTGGGGGGTNHCLQQLRSYFNTVFACDVLVYIVNLHSLFRSV